MTLSKLLPLIAILLAALVLIFSEYGRKNKARRWPRIGAVATAILCFLFLIFPFSWPWSSNEPAVGGHSGVLVTEGFEVDSVKKLTGNKPEIPVYTNEDLYRIDKDLQTIHIFGYGIPLGSAPIPENAGLLFHEPAQKGIVSVNWKRKLFVGESLKIQGRYINHTASQVLIYLQGFGLMLDSVIIEGSSDKEFELSTIPKFKGRAVFRLLSVQNKDTLEINSVPVTLLEIQKPSVLFLSSSPDFEQKFFQQWLSEQGYALIARNRISKNRIEKKFFNSQRLNADRITADLLKSIQLVIGDASEINRLSPGEKLILTEAVSSGGMGLLIRTDSAMPEGALFRGKFSLKRSGRVQQSARIKLYDQPEIVNVPVDAALRYVSPEDNILPVVEDSSGNAFVSRYRYGAGNLAVSTLPDLYSLILSGKRNLYAEIWTGIINSLVSETGSFKDLQVRSAFPKKDQPLEIRILAPVDSVPELWYDGNRIALKQNADLLNFSDGICWPSKEGWNDFKMGNDSFSIYIFPKSDWKNVIYADRTAFTKQLVKKSNKKAETGTVFNRSRKKIEPFFLFLILTLSLIFLWVEKKFS